MSGPGYFEDRQSRDKKMFVPAGTPAVDIPLHKRHIFVNGATPQTPVNLPNVSEAAGFRFIIQAINVPGSGGIKIDYSNGSDETLELSMTTSEASVVFESDGINWHKSPTDSSA